MSYQSKIVVGFLAAATGPILATQAGADTVQPDTCTITLQPWDLRSYEAAAVHADGTVERLSVQDGSHYEPTSFEWDNGTVTAIWWAARTLPATSAADFYDVLELGPDCRFTTPYQAMPGKQDSVIAKGIYAPAPTPTPPSTSSTVPEPTAVVPPVVVDVATPTPVAHTPSTVPAPPVADQPPTTTVVELVNTTPAPRLPVTGGPQGFLAWLGLGVIAAGAGLIGATRRRT